MVKVNHRVVCVTWLWLVDCTRDWKCANETACSSIPDVTLQSWVGQLGMKNKYFYYTDFRLFIYFLI